MKTVQSIMTACVLLAACAAAAAGGTTAQLGVGVGFTVPMGDFNDPSYGLTRVSGYDPAATLSAYLIGPIHDELRWRIEVGKDKASASSDLEQLCALNGAGCGSAVIKRYNLGLQWDFETDGDLDPFLFATAGSYNQERVVNEFIVGVFPFEASDTHSDFGLRFGGGARYMLGNSWGAAIDLTFTGIFEGGERSNTWYFSPTGNLFISF